MRWLLLVLVVGAGACSAPDDDRRRSALQSATRVLAIDFSPQAASRRTASWSRLPAAVGNETARLGDAVATTAAVAPELRRVDALQADTTSLLADELGRRPAMPDLLLPSAAEFGQDLADDLDLFTTGVFGRHRPMPEIDDVRHRTDPHDERPEASWWARIRRRLWL